MNHDLGVTPGVKVVTAGVQPAAKFRKVVDLAVEDDPRCLVLVVNRLVDTSHVDDAEPPDAQADAPLEPDPLVVRAPMGDRLAHPFEQSVVGFRPSSCGNAADP